MQAIRNDIIITAANNDSKMITNSHKSIVNVLQNSKVVWFSNGTPERCNIPSYQALALIH